MKRAITKAEDLPAAEPPRRDEGATFIELLVALVLIGTTVIGVLVALQASTVASTTDAAHARAYAWLHDASDSVFEAPRIACNLWDGGDPTLESSWDDRIGVSTDMSPNGTTGTIWGVYNYWVENTPRPQGWSGAQIAITKIEFLKPVGAETNTFEWGTACYEGVIPDANGDGAADDYRDTPLVSQKVTIMVTAPDGAFTRTLETVKAD